MWVAMEYYKHSDGLYYVIRYKKDGGLSTMPFGWREKSAAVNYIIAHGLEPKERF